MGTCLLHPIYASYIAYSAVSNKNISTKRSIMGGLSSGAGIINRDFFYSLFFFAPFFSPPTTKIRWIRGDTARSNATDSSESPEEAAAPGQTLFCQFFLQQNKAIQRSQVIDRLFGCYCSFIFQTIVRTFEGAYISCLVRFVDWHCQPRLKSVSAT